MGEGTIKIRDNMKTYVGFIIRKTITSSCVVVVTVLLEFFNSSICTATCNSGYEFDSGLSSETRVCDDSTGSWTNGNSLPSCTRKLKSNKYAMTRNWRN